jgi:hypothetical protein
MKFAFLVVSLVFFGLCPSAHANLIGSTVDLQRYYPDLSTLLSDAGPTTVSGALEYSNVGSFSVDITGNQIVIGSLAAGNLNFTSAPFNGFEFLFLGVTITGATVDASSTFAGNPVINIVGNNIFLNYSNVNTGSAFSKSIINVTTSTDVIPTPPAVPEPGALTLFATGLLGLGLKQKRRFDAIRQIRNEPAGNDDQLMVN